MDEKVNQPYCEAGWPEGVTEATFRGFKRRPEECDHDAALLDPPTDRRRELRVCPDCGEKVMVYRSYADYIEG